jgi:dsRNA-specific ribonuclease
VPTADELDIARARHLLGPPGGAALRAATVAEAWFGQAVDRTTVEHFARVLESVGLVRRDDHQRDRLWVLGVQESSLFPDEAELEESLKQANPKGRLLEFCMRMRIEPPVTDLQQEGAFFVATMSVRHAGETLDSGPCRAAAKKTAEQQAAQTLLDMIASRDRAEEVVQVTPEDSVRLQSCNPKGRLLEWCARHRLTAPHFQQDASPAGYRVRGRLSLGTGEDIVTPWYDAAKPKLGEQAAAEAMLHQLPDEPVAAQSQSQAAPQAPVQMMPPVDSGGRNPAMALNELCQVGILQAAGYEVLDQTGPSHQPTFSVVAWATTPDGTTFRTDPIQAPSKKSGQRLAAEQLFDLLVTAGLSRR